MKHIVTIGGGSGQPTLLRGLTQFPYQISALVSMMDNGGSSGILRRERGVLPPGDLRRSIVALAANELESVWNDAWEQRDEEGHAMGNLALLEKATELGDMQQAADFFLKEMQSPHAAICSTLELTDLAADFSDGSHVIGEHAIDVPADSDRDPYARLTALTLAPSVPAADSAVQAIATADAIVLSMGDVFTSVIPVLLLSGLTEAIAARQAVASIPVIAMCNRTTKFGETHGFTAGDFIDTFQQYLGAATLTHMIMDSYAVPVPNGTEAVQDTVGDNNQVHVTRVDLSDPDNQAVVSGAAAAQAIHQLIG